MPTHTTPSRTLSLALLFAAALAGSFASRSKAQIVGDRQSLSNQGGEPYVMILLDNSGSMNWATECTAQDRADGLCFHDCPAPNCPQPRNGDDPNSKIYQAKQALYEVLLDFANQPIRWGWGAMNQDRLAVAAKHWLYEVRAVATTGSTTVQFPAVGWQEVFGPRTGGAGDTQFDINCDRNEPTTNNSNAFLYEAGCYMTTQDAIAYTTTDPWSLNKLRRLPKGGADGSGTAVYFVRDAGSSPANFYRVSYAAISGQPIDYATTDSFDVVVTIDQCASANVINDAASLPRNCSAWVAEGTRTVTYGKVGPFFFWEGSPSRDVSTNSQFSKDSYFGGRTDGLPVELEDVKWANALFADKTCRGLEPSGPYPAISGTIVETDAFAANYNLKDPRNFLSFDPAGTADDWLFENGDFLPWRWEDPDNVNYQEILQRLNPKHPLVDSESYGQAPFFNDVANAGETFLRLKVEDDDSTPLVDEADRPLVSLGSTPLAGWFSMFRNWYSGCGDPGGCTDTDGWSDYARQFDFAFDCTKKYVMLITDGEESCDGSPQAPAENYYGPNSSEFPDGFSSTASHCRYRASLRAQEDVETFVLGFGVENFNALKCGIAGGRDDQVFLTNNIGELKAKIREVLDSIVEDVAAFASAAVPTVQANILDKIYLSSFVPLNNEAIWPGRLDAFLKPLPLDPLTGLPDRTVCLTGQQSECFAWDAGDSQLAWDGDAGYQPTGFLLQAPRESEISRDLSNAAASNVTLQIGIDADERRVFWGRPDAVPVDPSNPDQLGHRRYFRYPENDLEWLDLAFVWNIPTAVPPTAAEKDSMADIIEFTLREKQATATSSITGTTTNVQFLLGDIFHANPVVLNPPSDFEFFTKDLYWNSPLCGDTVTGTRNRGEQISYSWYSNKNICRRVMVAVGSNDGQLHVFDGGILRDRPDDPTTATINEAEAADCLLNVPTTSSSFAAGLFDSDGSGGAYDVGSGRELFSFIPQQMMPHIKTLSEINELTVEYGVDGTPRTADVFIDPVPTAGVPTCTDRTWRTVLLGGYREGGPGVYALDVTQPDVFDGTTNEPLPLPDTPDYVPSCIEGGGGCDEFCGVGDTECQTLPFPALKWEFRDLTVIGAPADDDLNGVADLAEGWSRPLVFRHPVCTGACDTPVDADRAPADLEDRWLAVFGGGLPELPSNDAAEASGNWLYMVDIETGELVYKRGGFDPLGAQPVIAGAVPADITGVDRDNDGIVDTLYFGTTAGFVYKVDLGDDPWELDAATGLLLDPVADAGLYDPFVIFTTDGRPIYLEINAVFLSQDSTALLFGTGIRWNLWDQSGITGRFYALLDDGWEDEPDLVSGLPRDGVIDAPCGFCPTPLDESVYVGIDPDDTLTPLSDFLTEETAVTLPGWYFLLDADEKLITEPFTLSGVSIFTFFDPVIGQINAGNQTGSCVFTGDSKIFIVNTVTTKGYAVDIGTNDRTRYTTTSAFTTQPFVEPSLTKNQPTSSSDANADTWTTALAEINADLKKLFPRGARFANYTLDIKTIRKDTRIVFIAPVPVAIEPHNWREF